MGIPLQTFSFTAQLKRESELVLLFSEKPYTSIITTFTPFCYSDHTDGFFSSCASGKKDEFLSVSCIVQEDPKT